MTRKAPQSSARDLSSCRSLLWKQVTRGHNIVADGWAGASNPHPHPNPLPTLKHTQKVSKTLVFPLFNSITMTDGPTDQRTNGPTDQRTDKASYRVSCPQLKRGWTMTNEMTNKQIQQGIELQNMWLQIIHASCAISRQLPTFVASMIRFTLWSWHSKSKFLVACTRLYTLLCPSVRRLVGRLHFTLWFLFWDLTAPAQMV